MSPGIVVIGHQSRGDCGVAVFLSRFVSVALRSNKPFKRNLRFRRQHATRSQQLLEIFVFMLKHDLGCILVDVQDEPRLDLDLGRPHGGSLKTISTTLQTPTNGFAV